MQIDLFLDRYDPSQIAEFMHHVAHVLDIPDNCYISVFDEVDDDENALGYMLKLSPRSFEIYIKPDLNNFDLFETIAHEMSHIIDKMGHTYRERDEIAEKTAIEIVSRYMEITYD